MEKTSSTQNSTRSCLTELRLALEHYRIWASLSWQDIRLRYRRSFLGPLWISLNTAVTVYTMGFIYSYLFKIDTTKYLPYIAAGILLWTLISSLVSELTETFIEATQFIKQIKLPYPVYLLRVIARNFIVFLHNSLAIIPLLLYYQVCFHLPLFLVGLAIFFLFTFSSSFLFALLGARFRDVKPIITSLLQLGFFVTPIMWMPDMLPAKFLFLVKINPIYHLIELIRPPLMGQIPTPLTFFTTIGMTLVSFFASLILFSKVKRRIIFWL